MCKQIILAFRSAAIVFPKIEQMVRQSQKGNKSLVYHNLQMLEHLVVNGQNECATGAAQGIAECTFVQRLRAFVSENASPTFQLGLIALLAFTGFHHKPPSDSVERIAEQ